MGTDKFFDETREQSAVKAAIVSKYFWAWAKVIIPTARNWKNRIAYIDLFAGPGRYKDGTKSTPLLVLEQAIQDSDMSQMLVTVFNDRDKTNCRSLETSINEIPEIEKLTHKPRVMNYEVGEEIVKELEAHKLVPTFFFLDPWGYKGLSLRLVNSVLKNWGCDCIFFFNYNRINMGLNNEYVKEHVDALFGTDRANRLRERLEPLNPEQREFTIVEEIARALTEMGGKYVLPFCFRNDSGTRTSHHLIFVSKHFRGYEIMKEIMAKESTNNVEGVSSFQYCPADVRQPILFSLMSPIDQLANMLLSEFAGKEITAKELYEQHSVGKPYILKNYRDVLILLKDQGKITTEPLKLRRNTFPPHVKIKFPS